MTARSGLFEQFWTRNRPVRLIGVGLSGFGKPNRQMDLWADRESAKHDEDLQSTLDSLRDRYGESTIRRASDLHHRQNEDNKR